MRKYLQKRIKLFKSYGNPDFPNKCDICGLMAGYIDQSTDDAILKTGELESCGITKNYLRNIHASGGGSNKGNSTFFCVLSNNKYWNRPFKKCPDWQLRISDKLTLSDYISIHHSRHNTRIAKWLAGLASFLTIIVIILMIILKA
jgi:hypothetical protein